MNRRTYYRRSLAHNWRTNAAVVLSVMAGAAALTGALIVGDSMRGSLRDLALDRLGSVTDVMRSGRYVRQALADELQKANSADQVAPAIIIDGSVASADSGRRVGQANVLGVNEQFWKVTETDKVELDGRSVALNRALADELKADIGDDVLLRVGKRSAISAETLLGRRNAGTTTLRLKVAAILPNDGVGSFTLDTRQYVPRNAFVPLELLQRTIDQRDRVNAILYSAYDGRTTYAVDAAGKIETALHDKLQLADVGLRLRRSDAFGYVALESDAALIDPPVERAVLAAATELDATPSPVFTYLANTIALVTNDEASAGIPYSTVSGVQISPTGLELPSPDGDIDSLGADDILLNEWAADDLGAQVGDPILLTYYVTGPKGTLETKDAKFTLRGVVKLKGPADDKGFTPEFPGITDSPRLSDWDPPFPVDLSRMRPRDDAYWDEYRATPKAFVPINTAQNLWADEGERFGNVTSMRLYPNGDADLAAFEASLQKTILERLEPEQLGLIVLPIRANALAASTGSTDFGGLFIAFSFFVIAAAMMLVALSFRLGVERRAPEIGLLLATGFRPRTVTWMLAAEGAVLAVIGSAIGLVVAVVYAQWMIHGLTTWWSAAVGPAFLRLHVSPTSLATGYLISVLIAEGSVIWAIRGLTRQSPTALIAGRVNDDLSRRAKPSRASLMTGVVAFVAAAVFIVMGAMGTMPAEGAFFGGGTALLVAALAFLLCWLRREPDKPITASSTAAARLGARGAGRNPGRSLLTVSLIASATFVIVAVEPFRMDVGNAALKKTGGAGGFDLVATSASPILADLNTLAGRDALGFPPETNELLDETTVMAFRLRRGDDTSCLNLYQPGRPSVIGAPPEMIERGGFAFSSTLADTERERENPWRLLEREFEDGAIPAIGDEAAVMWQLHLGLGKDLVVVDERGNDKKLRFVALLAGSLLQSEVVVAEKDFLNLYPDTTGYSYFLIDTPATDADKVSTLLEDQLADYGFDAALSRVRLAEYLAVQNTYLSTFQAIGGLGLLLGTIGLAAVLLRNVLERRGELALMRAIGFRNKSLGLIVMAENALLLVAGLAIGAGAALVSVAPHAIGRPGATPWLSLLLTLAGVLAAGLLAGALALVPTLRTPLLPALRSE